MKSCPWLAQPTRRCKRVRTYAIGYRLDKHAGGREFCAGRARASRNQLPCDGLNGAAWAGRLSGTESLAFGRRFKKCAHLNGPLDGHPPRDEPAVRGALLKDLHLPATVPPFEPKLAFEPIAGRAAPRTNTVTRSMWLAATALARGAFASPVVVGHAAIVSGNYDARPSSLNGCDVWTDILGLAMKRTQCAWKPPPVRQKRALDLLRRA